MQERTPQPRRESDGLSAKPATREPQSPTRSKRPPGLRPHNHAGPLGVRIEGKFSASAFKSVFRSGTAEPRTFSPK